jgi:hypothetical protein
MPGRQVFSGAMLKALRMSHSPGQVTAISEGAGQLMLLSRMIN